MALKLSANSVRPHWNIKRQRKSRSPWVCLLIRVLIEGITSENVAKKYNISRQAQDEFAASSYQKAEAAQKAGYFDEEIYPVTVKYSDPKTGDETTITVTKDDGVRPGTTVESLSKLKPAFSKDGSTHAGNASQVSDGAAAVILARRSVAEKH